MSIIFNGVGVLLTDSKIILTKLINKEGKYYISVLNASDFPEQLSKSTTEILLISYLEDHFDTLEEEDSSISKIRVLLPQNFTTIFSFPLEKTFNSLDIKKQIEWEFSVLFPQKEIKSYLISNFVTEINGQKFVNVFVLKKNLPNAFLKFATRKKINIDFFEQPAIAAFRAAKLTENEFDFLISAEDNYISIISASGNKIESIKSFSNSEENITSQLLPTIENSTKENSKVILTGSETKDLEETLNSKSNIEIIKPNFSDFIEDESKDKIDAGFFPFIIGLLSRVR